MSKNKTGYKVGKLIGVEDNLLIIDGTGVKNKCSKCAYYYDEDCQINNHKYCERENCYYVGSISGSNFKDRYRVINMKDLSNSCSDFCMFNGPNCYNLHKDTCLIRLIEKSSTEFNRSFINSEDD